jgi:hypothetical protein
MLEAAATLLARSDPGELARVYAEQAKALRRRGADATEARAEAVRRLTAIDAKHDLAKLDDLEWT